jgi:hypothetical protein
MSKETSNDLQNTTQKTKVRATGGKLTCPGGVSSSCSTSDTRRAALASKLVIGYERGKYRVVITTSGTYPWSFVTQIFHNG